MCPCSEGGCQRHRRSRGQENTTPHKSGHVVAESYFTPTGRGSERNQGAPQQRRRRSWHLALGHGRRARTRVSCTCKSVDRYSVQRARCLAIHGHLSQGRQCHTMLAMLEVGARGSRHRRIRDTLHRATRQRPQGSARTASVVNGNIPAHVVYGGRLSRVLARGLQRPSPTPRCTEPVQSARVS